jgi:hypothetical protein
MKHITIITICCTLLLSGCYEKEENHDLLSTTELAKALGLSAMILEVPEESKSNREPFYFRKESSNGKTIWFGGFQAPEKGQHIKIISNIKTKEVVVQSDETQYGYTLSHDDLEHSTGWQGGHVKYSDYIMCFGDSYEAVVVAQYPAGVKFDDLEAQKRADNATWIRYKLFKGSDMPEDTPLHILDNIERMMQNQSQ